MNSRLYFDAKIDACGTSLQGIYKSPWSFEETVARLVALTGQNPTGGSDEYKVSICFAGTFGNGSGGADVFTLYDYKEDRQIHVGGNHGRINVQELAAILTEDLSKVEPTPYKAEEFYDCKTGHQWPLAGSENAGKEKAKQEFKQVAEIEANTPITAGTNQLVANVALKLDNGARPILHAWNSKGTGIVLADWNGELVVWRMGLEEDGRVTCEHGDYFTKDDAANAIKRFHQRVKLFFNMED